MAQINLNFKFMSTKYRIITSQFFESYHINAESHVMNQNDGISFLAVYLNLLKL